MDRGRAVFLCRSREVRPPSNLTPRHEINEQSFSWINWAEWAGVPTDKFPTIERWMAAIQARPATETGVNVPEEFAMKKAMKTPEGAEEYGKMHSNWVMQGQSEEQARQK